RHVIGDRNYPTEMLHAMISLERAKPGEIVAEALDVPGLGSGFQWVDSVTASPPPAYEQVRPQVLAEYRREVGRRALEAKRPEPARRSARVGAANRAREPPVRLLREAQASLSGPDPRSGPARGGAAPASDPTHPVTARRA